MAGRQQCVQRLLANAGLCLGFRKDGKSRCSITPEHPIYLPGMGCKIALEGTNWRLLAGMLMERWAERVHAVRYYLPVPAMLSQHHISANACGFEVLFTLPSPKLLVQIQQALPAMPRQFHQNGLSDIRHRLGLQEAWRGPGAFVWF